MVSGRSCDNTFFLLLWRQLDNGISSSTFFETSGNFQTVQNLWILSTLRDLEPNLVNSPSLATVPCLVAWTFSTWYKACEQCRSLFYELHLESTFCARLLVWVNLPRTRSPVTTTGFSGSQALSNSEHGAPNRSDGKLSFCIILRTFSA